MKDKDIQALVDINFRYGALLGITSAIMEEYKRLLPDIDHSNKCDWFNNAIEAVVYQDKPVPSFPTTNVKSKIRKEKNEL